MKMIDPFAVRVECSCCIREVGDVSIIRCNLGNHCANKTTSLTCWYEISSRPGGA